MPRLPFRELASPHYRAHVCQMGFQGRIIVSTLDGWLVIIELELRI
jgi:hypothetical protein